LFKRDRKGEIFSTQNGKAVELTQVPDVAFSEKMLGEGVAIIPDDGKVYSPVDGKLIDVKDTMQAYSIETSDGIDVLVNIGVNTDKLKGVGFKSSVKTGDNVKKGDLLAEADIKFLREKGYPILTPIVITNMDAVKAVTVKTGEVTAADSCVISYTLK
jgi:glucose-specific phosphotransferase system IIA component